MGAGLSTFAFDVYALQLDADWDFFARIPPRLSSRESLFEALCRELRFPDYFGYNWDALYDCLRDLSWIKSRRVVILHEDVPPLEPKAIATYLEILSDCIRDWKSGELHELIVVFPGSVRPLLRVIKARDVRLKPNLRKTSG